MSARHERVRHRPQLPRVLDEMSVRGKFAALEVVALEVADGEEHGDGRKRRNVQREPGTPVFLQELRAGEHEENESRTASPGGSAQKNARDKRERDQCGRVPVHGH